MWPCVVDVTEVGNLQQALQTGEGKAFQFQIGRHVYALGVRGYARATRQPNAWRAHVLSVAGAYREQTRMQKAGWTTKEFKKNPLNACSYIILRKRHSTRLTL